MSAAYPGLRILVACECSGAMSQALRAAGHMAFSCDIKPSPGFESWHFQCSVFDVPGHWDVLIAFPPCTYLAKARLWDKSPGRVQKRNEAVEFVRRLESISDRYIIENPIGHLSSAWRPPNQIIRPWWFGDPFRKDICLWTRGFPPLMATLYNPVRKPMQNKVNGRMSQDQKSHIKSSWLHFPGMVSAIVHQYFGNARA